MRKTWRFETALLAGVISAAVAVAQSGGGPGGPGGFPRCGDQLSTSLALGADQQSALDALRQQTADAIQPIADSLHALHQQIDDAVAAASPDRCAVGDLTIQAGGLRSQIDAARKAAEAAFVASLSTDQKAKYDTFVGINPECTAIGGGFGPPPQH
jgi:Spy/CpxP family protein refolding chaperone